jgi:hypothetical protein
MYNSGLLYLRSLIVTQEPTQPTQERTHAQDAIESLEALKSVEAKAMAGLLKKASSVKYYTDAEVLEKANVPEQVIKSLPESVVVAMVTQLRLEHSMPERTNLGRQPSFAG